MKKFLCVILILIVKPSFAQYSVKEAKAILTGQWEWIKTLTLSRAGGGTKTPLTCDCKQRIAFENGNVIKEYRNDSLISASKFTLEKSDSPQYKKEVLLRSEHMLGSIHFKSDTIEIGNDGGCDNIHYYKRIKAPTN